MVTLNLEISPVTSLSSSSLTANNDSNCCEVNRGQAGKHYGLWRQHKHTLDDSSKKIIKWQDLSFVLRRKLRKTTLYLKNNIAGANVTNTCQYIKMRTTLNTKETLLASSLNTLAGVANLTSFRKHPAAKKHQYPPRRLGDRPRLEY